MDGVLWAAVAHLLGSLDIEMDRPIDLLPTSERPFVTSWCCGGNRSCLALEAAVKQSTLLRRRTTRTGGDTAVPPISNTEASRQSVSYGIIGNCGLLTEIYYFRLSCTVSGAYACRSWRDLNYLTADLYT